MSDDKRKRATLFEELAVPSAVVREVIAREHTRSTSERAYPFGIVRAVTDASEVGTLTANGWMLAAIKEEQAFVFPPRYQDGFGPTYEQGKAPPPQVVTRLVYIMAQSRDVEMTNLRNEKEEARRWGTEAKAEADAAMRVHDAAAAQRDEALAALATQQRLAEARTEELTNTRDALIRIEKDLAKVRAEVGEAEWRRICGSVPRDVGPRKPNV